MATVVAREEEVFQKKEVPANGEIMKIDEVARLLRIPESSLYRLAEEGRIPCVKVGKHWRFRMSTLSRWMDIQEEERWPSRDRK